MIRILASATFSAWQDNFIACKAWRHPTVDLTSYQSLNRVDIKSHNRAIVFVTKITRWLYCVLVFDAISRRHASTDCSVPAPVGTRLFGLLVH